jgi:hypothetical protein
MHIIRVTPNYMYQTKIYQSSNWHIQTPIKSSQNPHDTTAFSYHCTDMGLENQNWININSQILNQSRFRHFLTTKREVQRVHQTQSSKNHVMRLQNIQSQIVSHQPATHTSQKKGTEKIYIWISNKLLMNFVPWLILRHIFYYFKNCNYKTLNFENNTVIYVVVSVKKKIKKINKQMLITKKNKNETL